MEPPPIGTVTGRLSQSQPELQGIDPPASVSPAIREAHKRVKNQRHLPQVDLDARAPVVGAVSPARLNALKDKFK